MKVLAVILMAKFRKSASLSTSEKRHFSRCLFLILKKFLVFVTKYLDIYLNIKTFI